MVEEDSKNKRSKHIQTKITYAKEQFKLGILDIIYLPTLEMTADMLTKPLHGEHFKYHRKTLMGLNHQ
jgi:hypothetical protein